MDSIFPQEVPKNFMDDMKNKLRVIKICDRADNFKGKENTSGLESESFESNIVSHYFFFIAEKIENKMDISYKFFCGNAKIQKAYDIISGKKKVDNTINYTFKLKEIVNNPLCIENTETMRKALYTNILIERKNKFLEN